MTLQPAWLALEDGSSFSGFAPSWQTEANYGEVVFTTGMTGYEKSLTDPSYAGQILVFTYPLIGNYGVPPADTWESEKIHAHGVVVSEAALNWSHTQGTQSLLSWLKQQQVPILIDTDTRALTKRLRSSGSLLGALTPHPDQTHSFVDPNTQDLVARVSIKQKKSYPHPNATKKLIIVDCGMKTNILRTFSKFPLSIERVPHNYDFTEGAEDKDSFDGIFLSNGPGNPIQCSETVRILRKALDHEKPIFGICLGTQLLALAAGAKTYKLPYGHRGHNQPCIDTETQRCYITSQNHGYAIDEQTLPEGWKVSFRNLNDGSVEGISHNSLPFSAVQFHPEAAPGPTDTQGLIEEFVAKL